MRDFTLRKYQELCDTLFHHDYSVLTVYDYLVRNRNDPDPDENTVVLRHDVDRKLHSATRMANLEKAMGIRSTYYFRYPYTFHPDTLIEIHGLGHEIGYHYEVLAKTRGNAEQAIQLFERELSIMRETCEIHTICMHGSPLSRFDNRALWDHYDFRDFGIIGEAYLSMNTMHYYSDTGRSWNAQYSLRDMVNSGSRGKGPETTDELIDTIVSQRENPLYISIHPERWNDSLAEWYRGYLRDFIFNTGKRVIIRLRT